MEEQVIKSKIGCFSVRDYGDGFLEAICMQDKIDLMCGAIYIIKGEKTTLIDAGSPLLGQQTEELFRKLGIPLKSISNIFLTHIDYDHLGPGIFPRAKYFAHDDAVNALKQDIIQAIWRDHCYSGSISGETASRWAAALVEAGLIRIWTLSSAMNCRKVQLEDFLKEKSDRIVYTVHQTKKHSEWDVLYKVGGHIVVGDYFMRRLSRTKDEEKEQIGPLTSSAQNLAEVATERGNIRSTMDLHPKSWSKELGYYVHLSHQNVHITKIRSRRATPT